MTQVNGVMPTVSDHDPILGKWLVVEGNDTVPVDVHRRRYGIVAPTFADFEEWRFVKEGLGLRVEAVPVGADGARQPTVNCFATLDGRPWADPFGPAYLGQLVQQWRLDSHLLLRLVLDNVVPPERIRWTVFAVEDDGAIMTATSWQDISPDETAVTRLRREGSIQPVAAPLEGAWRIGDALTLRRTRSGTRSLITREFGTR